MIWLLNSKARHRCRKEVLKIYTILKLKMTYLYIKIWLSAMTESYWV